MPCVSEQEPLIILSNKRGTLVLLVPPGSDEKSWVKKQTMTIDQLETTKSDTECPSVGQNHIVAAQGVSRLSYVGYR